MPLKGSGPIRFGMNRASIVKILGKPDSQFKRNPFAEIIEVVYEKKYSIGFDSSDICIEILFFPDSKPTLNGVELLSMPAKDAQKIIQKMDPKFTFENDTIFSKKLGIGIITYDFNESPEDPGTALLLLSQEALDKYY